MGRSSVVVGDQGTLDRRADVPVVPDGGVERQEPLDDPGPQPGGDTAAVAFQAELVLERPDDRLDALPQPVGEVPGGRLVVAGRAEQGEFQAGAGEERLGVGSGQVLFVFFNDTATAAIYTLSLHDALPTGPMSGSGSPSA